MSARVTWEVPASLSVPSTTISGTPDKGDISTSMGRAENVSAPKMSQHKQQQHGHHLLRALETFLILLKNRTVMKYRHGTFGKRFFKARVPLAPFPWVPARAQNQTQSSAWILQGRPQAAACKKPGCGGLWARQDVSLHLVTTGLMYSGKSRGSKGFQTLEDTFSSFRSPQPIWKELLDTTNFFQILIVLWLFFLVHLWSITKTLKITFSLW